MNVTETNAEGLRRELKVVVGADELEEKLSSRLEDLKGKARIKGLSVLSEEEFKNLAGI